MKLCGKCLAISETASWKKCEAGEKLEKHLDIWETPASPRAPASRCLHCLFLLVLWIGSFFSSTKLSALVQLQSCPCLAPLKARDKFPSDPRHCYLGLVLGCYSNGKLRALSVIPLAALNGARPSKITEIGGFTEGQANLPNPAPWGFPRGHPGCAGFTLSGKALKSCFSLHLETTERKSFLWEGEGSSREKPDHTAKPIW